MLIKKEIRILGIDDAPFEKDKSKDVLVVGTIFRGSSWLDGLISTKIEIDGNDATEKIADMINNTKHKEQLRIVFLDGIAFGGFNVVDIKLLSKKVKLPVITVMRNYPDFEKIEKALKNVSDYEDKIKLMKKAGEIHEVTVNDKKLFVQFTGIKFDKLVEILKLTCTHAIIPEPLRVAHIIASGIVTGESKGRA
ncbi:MAG: DUF99 family protein [Nanoarchaeota archaeon]|nr:DUF99 family protein [Nanoarchaeota archaeon]